MFIVIRQDGREQRVLNVLYGEHDVVVKQWVSQYLLAEMESLLMCPNLPDTKQVSYVIEDVDDVSRLIKNYKKVNRGYVYNSSEKLSEEVFSVKVLQYDGLAQVCESVSQLYTNIAQEYLSPAWITAFNAEVNKRVIKQLDAAALRQVFRGIDEKMSTKEAWNRTEYTSMVSEVLINFKKELYSGIAKKLKRFEKKQAAHQQFNADIKKKVD